mmetsp:Transcript_26834/g.47492  ORF Transcript_26834/g.47492 Transcript_26834/m.47492 type:complete len:322 (+) Transcript_26834:242-1207(+)
MEFSGSGAIWANLSAANLSSAYSRKEGYWCPLYQEKYIKLHAANQPALCPFWFDVWDVYIDKQHAATLRIDTLNADVEKQPLLAIRAAGVGLNKTKIHQIMLFKRTGPKKGGTSFGGFILENQARVHRFESEYLPDRKIEILGASEENGECALGSRKDFYSSLLESSRVAYGSVLGDYFQADYHFVALGSADLVGGEPLAKPDSGPFLKYYKRALYGVSGDDWDFNSYIPNIVLIANGITDWQNGVGNNTLMPKFANNLAQLLTTLRKQYPETWILFVPWQAQQIRGVTAGVDLYQRQGANNDTKVVIQVDDLSRNLIRRH